MKTAFMPAALPGLLLCGWLLTGGALSAQETSAPLMKRPVPREVVTEESLRQQMGAPRKMREMVAQSQSLLPVQEGRRPEPRGTLETHSILLFDGQRHTYVPQGAVLHLPAALRERVIFEPQGEFVLWHVFLKLNEAWLVTREVPLAMARGDAKAARGVLESLADSPHLVVAVYRNGPISILEPPPQETQAKR